MNFSVYFLNFVYTSFYQPFILSIIFKIGIKLLKQYIETAAYSIQLLLEIPFCICFSNTILDFFLTQWNHCWKKEINACISQKVETLKFSFNSQML